VQHLGLNLSSNLCTKRTPLTRSEVRMRVAFARWVRWCSGSGGTIAHNASLTETIVTIIMILYGTTFWELLREKRKVRMGFLECGDKMVKDRITSCAPL